MAAWTLEEAQEKLATWMAADDAVAQGQSYVIDIGGNKRELTRANALRIQNSINFWRREVERLSSGQGGGGPRVRYVNPV
jgi:L-arabinose isomerase